MRRRFLLLVISLAAMSIVIVSGLLIWLLGTNEGARWAFSRLSRSLPVAVTIDRFEGSLAGNLKIAGVHFRHPEWAMDIETGDISWHPLELVFGHAGFDHLYLRKVTFTDIRPGDQPLDLTWPVMPSLLARFWGGVTAFQIDNLIYRKQKRDDFKIDRLQARVQWRFGTITASDLDVESPQGHLTGTMGASFNRPALFGDVILKPRRDIAGYEQVRISIKSGKTSAPEQVAGELQLTAYKGKTVHLSAAGRMAIKKDGLLFQDLTISEAGRKGTMAVQGEIIFAQPDSLVDLQVRLNDLDLGINIVPPVLTNPDSLQSKERVQGAGSSAHVAKNVKVFESTSISGTLALKGTVRHYEGRFALNQRSPGKAWASGRLSGQIHGNERGVSIPAMTGEWLGGSLSGNLNWMWSGTQRLSGSLQGRGLDPSKIHGEWQGRVNINAIGSFEWNGDLPAHGSFSLVLMDSIVQGKTLSGNLTARWEGGSFQLDRSYLQGRGFRVDAHGNLNDGLQYEARITDLSGLVPGASGRFTGGGWVRWKQEQWAGLLKGSGPINWTKDGVAVTFTQADARWEGSKKGVQASWNLALDQSGRFEGDFSSPVPAVDFVFPLQGQFRASWRAVDIHTFKALWGHDVDCQGRSSGKIQGGLFPGERFEVHGEMELPEGKISRKTDRGIISMAIRRSTVAFNWKEAILEGRYTMELGSRGQTTGAFQLPIPARIPLKMDKESKIVLEAKGDLHEKGLISSLFPGVVKESRGNIQFDARIAGTWKDPQLNGTVKLDGAGAYFPRAGIRLDDAKAEAELVQDQIRIKTFRAKLGGAYLSGSATIRLKDREISNYDGVLSGDHIQTVYTPEIRLWTSPDLRFSGTMKKLVLRGIIRVPEAQIRYAETEGVIRASRDAVIVDLPKKNKDSSPIAFDTQVAVVLGDKVFVDAAGLHAQLGGRVVLSGESMERMMTDGQIDVLKGYYERYGVKLDIVRGRAVFKAESADRGNLDILAIKKVRDKQRDLDVEAGVIVTGNVQSPLVKLYGRPAMDDRDVISYMVIGQPYQTDTGGSQKDQIAQWAAAILKGTPSSSFPRRLQERLGIDTVGVETGSTGGIVKSVVTIGKYLSPDLYVAFGRSLFGDDYYISTRYSFLKHWQIESKVGLQTGTDLFYRIEFE